MCGRGSAAFWSNLTTRWASMWIPGTTLAKVVQPDQLKASLKIAETQARDIQIGQPAEIDTHNGVIDGKVMRIDPASIERNGDG